MSLAAVVIVVAARVMGVLLVSARLSMPAAAAMQLGRGLRATTALSKAFGLSSVIVDLAATIELGAATRATIALGQALVFAFVAGGSAMLRRLR